MTINFVNSCNITDNITYQFKVEFENQEKQRLTENFKDKGIWYHDEKITQKIYLMVTATKKNQISCSEFKFYSFTESTFYLVFTLIYEKSMIYV